MRFIVAGLLLLAGVASVSQAQITGEVESIGFNNHYRPACWTPMVVHLRVETEKTDTYQLQVRQEDLDRDIPVYTRTITVTGTADGRGSRSQKFWMYFIPQPSNVDGSKGLPEASYGLRKLQEKLKVKLCSADGKREIASLPVTTTILNVEPPSGPFSGARGAKFILCVSDGSQPVWKDYESAVGILENVQFVSVQPHQLPEDVRGYDAVDSIVWFDSDPTTLNLPTDERMRAVRSYVRGGGELVICQPGTRDRMRPFGDLLPVTVQEIVDLDRLDPLRAIANNRIEQPIGPFKLARAQAKPGALVEEWITWPDESPRTPYLVRAPYGLGSTTWVAQDLADRAITRGMRIGWPQVWDRVFGWNNETQVIVDRKAQAVAVETYANGSGVDLGRTLLPGMEHGTRSHLLIMLAIVFFIAYWIVAGPGAYAYLASKKRSSLSWFGYAVCALVATALTVLVVRLVLRGPAELRHVSVVQQAPNQPTIVNSGLGLYIPRDGSQRIEIPNLAADYIGYITPYAIHPHHLSGTIDSPPLAQYPVGVREANAGEPVSLDVPYRSTLKKLEARWAGELPTGRIDGRAVLLSSSDGTIEGTVTNGLDHDLLNVYFVFNGYLWSSERMDCILYLPKWPAGTTLDLREQFRSAQLVSATPNADSKLEARPEDGKPVKGRIGKAGREQEWDRYWYRRLPSASINDTDLDESNTRVPVAFPIMSLFDRMPPERNRPGVQADRIELVRRGARFLDMSQAVAAGQLLVLAQSNKDEPRPVPLPLEVEGDKVTGEGTIYYQCVLPLDRSKVESIAGPTTTTQPAAESAPPVEQSSAAGNGSHQG